MAPKSTNAAPKLIFATSDPPRVGDLLAGLGIGPERVRQLAMESGWLARKPEKVTPESLLDVLCFRSTRGAASYKRLASDLDDPTARFPANRPSPGG